MNYSQAMFLKRFIFCLIVTSIVVFSNLGSLYAVTVSVASSGINLSTSMMQVDYTMSSFDDHLSFQCFGSTETINTTTNKVRISKSLLKVASILKSNQIDTSVTNCFRQAGQYDVNITLTDYAGNNTSQSFKFMVSAQEASLNSTLIQTDCEDSFANNYDTCKVSLTLRDQFNNILHGLTGAKVKLKTTKDSDPWLEGNIPLNCVDPLGNDCDKDTNLKTGFFDAVRIKENSSYQKIYNTTTTDFHEYTLGNNGKTTLEFRSMAPTLADNNQGWQEVVTRKYPLSLQGPVLTGAGAATTTVSDIGELKAPLKFKSPLEINIDVKIGHKPGGAVFTDLDAINADINSKTNRSTRQLIPCATQKSATFSLSSYSGDNDNDDNPDIGFESYQAGNAQVSDLALCPGFGVGSYTYQSSSYDNEGQYARIRLLQNNQLRTSANQTPSCGSPSDPLKVCLYDIGITESDGVPASVNFDGFLERTDTISFNNNNPDGVDNKNLDDTNSSGRIFVANASYGDRPLYPAGVDGLDFFEAINTDTDPTIDDFSFIDGVAIGKKSDLKSGTINSNYEYVWRFFEEGTDPEFQLKTIAEYSYVDGAGAVPVAYYAGEYGHGNQSCEEAVFRYNVNCSNFAANDPQYDILVTGDIIGSFATINQTTNLTDIGNIRTGFDMREQITKNAFVLSREIPSSNYSSSAAVYSDSQNTLFKNKFSSSGVYVVENTDLKLGSGTSQFILPPGKKTVIVRDGNVIIKSNLVYENSDDSFGIIVLCSNPKPYDTSCGNILIKPQVQRIVGTIFGDGGMMTSNGDSIIGSVINDDSFNKQLVIQGAIFTRNTIGGSQNSQSYFTPWENKTEMLEVKEGLPDDRYSSALAGRYDLRMMRPPTTDIDNMPTLSSGSGSFVTVLGEQRDNSVIIENDIGRTTQLTPPGFEVFTNTGR